MAGDQRQQGPLRGDEFFDPLPHQHFFQRRHIDLCIEFGEHCGRRQLSELPGEGSLWIVGGPGGGRGIGLDAVAGQRRNIGAGIEFRLLDSGAGKHDLLLKRRGMCLPEGPVLRPDAFGVNDPQHSLGGGGKTGQMLLRVDVDPRNKHAVDALEPCEGAARAGSSPDSITGLDVLRHREDERDVQRHTCRGQRLQRRDARWRGRHLDHAVGFACRPSLAEIDIAGHLLRPRQPCTEVLQQRVKLEAHPAIVAERAFPGLEKFPLRMPHQLVGERPGDGRIVLPVSHQRRDPVVKPSGLDQVGDDHRVARGPGGSLPPRLGHDLWIDRIEPHLCAGGHQRLETVGHRASSRKKCVDTVPAPQMRSDQMKPRSSSKRTSASTQRGTGH